MAVIIDKIINGEYDNDVNKSHVSNPTSISLKLISVLNVLKGWRVFLNSIISHVPLRRPQSRTHALAGGQREVDGSGCGEDAGGWRWR